MTKINVSADSATALLAGLKQLPQLIAQGVQPPSFLHESILDAFKARQEEKQSRKDVVRLTAASRETRV